jgi:UDP-N-acetylglucosamine 2-epimerase (non-hydrolysing)
MNKILIAYGTRPEYLKIKPIIENNSDLFIKTIHIQQHNDIIDFGNPDFILKIDKTCENRLNNIFSEILLKLNEILKDFDAILVQGDTATVAASALCAYNSKKKIIYLESGLRSFDLNNPYPEEAYRQMVSRIADINLCPTNTSKQNLEKENVLNSIYVVGNTCLDNLVEYKNSTTYSNKVLITLHRNENINIIEDWINEIDDLASKYKDIEFIFPVHPNPQINNAVKNVKYITLLKPLQHSELINILKNCKIVITDSGGIQEEGCFLNKKIIVCRKTTERPEGIATGHIHLCENPNNLIRLFDKLYDDYIISTECPYGDGNSTEKIIKILKNLYE